MQNNNGDFYFYCNICYADTRSDCYCDSIIGYDPGTGLPIVGIPEKDWDEYFSTSTVNRNPSTRQENPEGDSKGINNIDTDDTTETYVTENDRQCTIPKEVIEYLASRGNSDAADIEREGNAENYKIPIEVIDTWVLSRVYGEQI